MRDKVRDPFPRARHQLTRAHLAGAGIIEEYGRWSEAAMEVMSQRGPPGKHRKLNKVREHLTEMTNENSVALQGDLLLVDTSG